MQNFKKKFIPFPTDRVCDFNNPDIFHFDHPSCCRHEEFTAWRENYLKPMLEWENINPLPPFKKVRRCIRDISTHKDNPYCCNFDVKKQYDVFVNKTFKIIPLSYVNDVTWTKLQKYQFPNTFMCPVAPLIQGANNL